MQIADGPRSCVTLGRLRWWTAWYAAGRLWTLRLLANRSRVGTEAGLMELIRFTATNYRSIRNAQDIKLSRKTSAYRPEQ